MRKLILKCGLSPGDIVMMTAAVRDLHRSYPKHYETDVRTACPELWEHNPHITPISDQDPDAEKIYCEYPLIDGCNETPYHCLHGFIAFLNQRLRLSIRPSIFKGDIHLSSLEKGWASQAHEVAGTDIPFWIIAAGGKHDVTIKWWESRRYQEVVDHFRGKIQFVQVGGVGHHHPKLQGVIDFRGQTDLRELVRLVYHAQGVLCSITALMHLAAAVETKPGRPPIRPCVVIGGGREPAHWEQYPDHQFIHTNGALPCCAKGGCWKDRTAPLRDGNKRDRHDHRCVRVANGLPRCMDMITPQDIVRRIELYFGGGSLKYLSAPERLAGQKGVKRTAKNWYDKQPLNLHEAGLACDEFVGKIPAYPGGYTGRGIVICGGGARYFTCAWVCINMLRRMGCFLPIQLWYLGPRELNEEMRHLLAPLGVRSVDALRVRKRFPSRLLGGWELKPYAILHSPFREVLLLDADNVPVHNPEFLFEAKEFLKNGAAFWPDYARPRTDKVKTIWRSCGVRWFNEPEFETGQIVVDKERCWPALCLTMWLNENSDFYYEYVHGDKETFHIAFRKLKLPYALVPWPVHRLPGTMCQHDFEGRRIFQHRNTDKWDLFMHNKRVEDFWFEKECRDYIVQLRRVWDGGLRLTSRLALAASPQRRLAKSLRIQALMISCNEREELRRHTLERLAKTDWNGGPICVELDPGAGDDHRKRQTYCAYSALKRSLEGGAEYVLFLEDDLDFNRYLHHNLQHWPLLRDSRITLASLYNPRVAETAYDLKNNARIVPPRAIFGSQAFLISRETVAHLVRHWHDVTGMQDIRIARLAGRLGKPIFYHVPSLVQHVGATSVWGGDFHQAMDFDPDWKFVKPNTR